MNTKFKVLFAVSLLFNLLFVLLFVFAASAKINRVSFHPPDGDFVAAAAVVCVPKSGSVSFDLIEISLKPGDTAFLQFSVISSNAQSNLLFNALYDPGIVSVTRSGPGVEIRALKEGTALMQTFSNDGIKDIALIEVKNDAIP
jgi:hypothetical protein